MSELVPSCHVLPGAGACGRCACSAVRSAGHRGKGHGLAAGAKGYAGARVPRGKRTGAAGATRYLAHALIALQWLQIHGAALRQRWRWQPAPSHLPDIAYPIPHQPSPTLRSSQHNPGIARFPALVGAMAFSRVLGLVRDVVASGLRRHRQSRRCLASKVPNLQRLFAEAFPRAFVPDAGGF